MIQIFQDEQNENFLKIYENGLLFLQKIKINHYLYYSSIHLI